MKQCAPEHTQTFNNQFQSLQDIPSSVSFRQLQLLGACLDLLVHHLDPSRRPRDQRGALICRLGLQSRTILPVFHVSSTLYKRYKLVLSWINHEKPGFVQVSPRFSPVLSRFTSVYCPRPPQQGGSTDTYKWRQAWDIGGT